MVGKKRRVKFTDPKFVVTRANFGDLRYFDNALEEVEAINVLQYLTAKERIQFVNDLWNALKVDGKCKIQTPHWCSAKYYGDLEVAWPPMSEAWAWHLSRAWREQAGYKPSPYRCNFHVMSVYNLNPLLAGRNQQFNEFAINWYKETATDLSMTLTKYPMDKDA